jgi:hypothetical protein
MDTWDTPPTQDERAKAGIWDTPPTQEEGAKAGAFQVVKQTEAKLRDLQGARYQHDPPGLAGRAVKAIGETTADAITGATGIASFLDPALAAGGAVLSYTQPTDGTFSERWDREMRGLEGERSLARNRSPVANMAGSLAPMLLAGPAGAAPGATAPAASVASQAATMGRGVLGATALSAANAAGETAHLDPAASTAAVQDAVTSPVNLLPAALPLAARGLQGVSSALKGQIPRLIPRGWRLQVSPDAAALESQGVPLTTGQMSPGSPIAALEGATADKAWGLGPERHASEAAWRDVALKPALPPGMSKVPRGSFPDKMAAIYEGFDAAYSKVKGEQVYPAIHGKGLPLQSSANRPGAFELAVNDADVLAVKEERRIAKRFLDNQLTKLLGGEQRPRVLTPVDAGDLMNIRSKIRQASRKSKSGNKWELASLLDNAEQAVTDSIESQLSPELADHLRTTDEKYAVYKAIENAAYNTGGEGNFTPDRLATEARNSAGKAWTRGAGGSIRDLALQGKEVFTQDPATGWQGAVASQLPFLQHTAGIVPRIANNPTVKALLFGRTPAVAPPGPLGTMPVSQATALANALRQQTQQQENPDDFR